MRAVVPGEARPSKSRRRSFSPPRKDSGDAAADGIRPGSVDPTESLSAAMTRHAGPCPLRERMFSGGQIHRGSVAIGPRRKAHLRPIEHYESVMRAATLE